MVAARIVGILLLLSPTFSFAQESSESAYCNGAAVQAATDALMPPDVLLALTLVETGRSRDGSFTPWPWTVNMEGKGYWFDTRAEAVTFVTESYAAGARSFDVGCFQINHKWHGEAFTSFDQMFEPLDNAAYAAKFMTDLFNEGGSWSWAAGAYHSRTVSLASKYRTRFDRIVANLPSSSTDLDLPVMIARTENTATVVRLSTWSPIQAIDSPIVPVVNGSLAGGLLLNSGTALIRSPNGGLF